jgi:hypothetical protein
VAAFVAGSIEFGNEEMLPKEESPPSAMQHQRASDQIQFSMAECLDAHEVESCRIHPCEDFQL